MFKTVQSDIQMLPDPFDYKHAESTGTSIMAVVYDGGVLVGADSRTTSGSYIADRAQDKVDYLHERIYCLRSGSAADTQTLCSYVRYYLDVHSMELQRRPTVKTAAKLFSNLIYQYQDNLSAAVIVAGIDDNEGPSIYACQPSGSCIKQQVAIGGSGSGFIFSYVDANFKPNMDLESAKKLVKTSLAHAMSRDGSSGGIIRLVNITKDNVTREFFDHKDLPYHFTNIH
ncbi:hypothetical protein ABPG74_001719 [Tetrahymena malaccensis]